MKYNGKKITIVVLICIFSVAMCNITFAHSGRTDSSGGHRDNNNKSGLGSYHYHCGGHPAHLHTNGVCPYSSSSKNSKPSSSTSSQKTTTVEPTIINVEDIKINETVKEIKVGESKILTVTIKPNNSTDKTITWKSSNEKIATVSSIGKVIAKNPGTVEITATSSNGLSNAIKIVVKEDKNNVIRTSTTNKEKNNINATNKQKGEDDAVVGGITVAACGGGIAYAYKKMKKRGERK